MNRCDGCKIKDVQIARLVASMNDISDEVNSGLYAVREGDSAEHIFTLMQAILRKIDALAVYTDEDITVSRYIGASEVHHEQV